MSIPDDVEQLAQHRIRSVPQIQEAMLPGWCYPFLFLPADQPGYRLWHSHTLSPPPGERITGSQGFFCGGNWSLVRLTGGYITGWGVPGVLSSFVVRSWSSEPGGLLVFGLFWGHRSFWIFRIRRFRGGVFFIGFTRGRGLDSRIASASNESNCVVRQRSDREIVIVVVSGWGHDSGSATFRKMPGKKC